MSLDIRTLVLANSLMAFLCVIISFDVWTSGRRLLKGSGSWFIGFLFIALGMAGTSLRGILPAALTYGLANLFIYLGGAFQLIGVLDFTGRPPRMPLILGLAGLAFAVQSWFLFVSPDLLARLIIYNCYNIVLDFVAVGALVRSPGPSMRKSRYIAAWVFLLYALLHGFRLSAEFLWGARKDFFAGGTPDSVFFLASTLLLASLVFIELKLVNSRLIANVEDGAREKALLVREMSHRTKNNLALADSLIALEGHRFDDPRTLASIEAIRARLRSIGLLHDSLYRLDAVGRKVRLDVYLGSVVAALAEAAAPVVVEGLLEEVEADIDAAIPIGLVTGELVTNSLKYAYPPGEGGRVFVSLGLQGGFCRLAVRDWGTGFKGEPEEGLGSLLISSLAQQLGGVLSRKNDGGAVTELVFSPDGPARSG